MDLDLEASLRYRIHLLETTLRAVAPTQPMNQDEMGGCVWCGGTPPNSQYGYADADPDHHDPECAWLMAQQVLGGTHI